MLSVLTLSCLAGLVRTDTVFSETTVNTKRILTLADSPYHIENDVLVEPEGELIIQPNSGIIVRGVLNASCFSIKTINLNFPVMIISDPDH